MTIPETLPKYVQVSEFLIREIAAGQLIDGERLPPERQMAEEMGIAVGTLRKSLDILAEKGLLERVQGSGNYIRATETADSLYAMFRLELPGGGGLPKARLLDAIYVDKPADLPMFGRSRKATRIRRQRYLNTVSIAVEEIWLDGSAGRIEAGDLTDSLYQSYRARLGLMITRAEDRVSLAPLPDWSPDGFQQAPGTITGYIERLSWSDAPEPVEFSRTWFDTTRAHYVQRLK